MDSAATMNVIPETHEMNETSELNDFQHSTAIPFSPSVSTSPTEMTYELIDYESSEDAAEVNNYNRQEAPLALEDTLRVQNTLGDSLEDCVPSSEKNTTTGSEDAGSTVESLNTDEMFDESSSPTDVYIPDAADNSDSSDAADAAEDIAASAALPDVEIPEEVESADSIPEKDFITYRDSTYEIVSKVAYLIGVPKRIFEKETEAPKLEIYEQLDKNSAAKIIRHLCVLRSSIERNFKNINDMMRYEFRSILTLPEYVPAESINFLAAEGVNFYKKSSTKLNQHIIEINRLISDRINNCKQLFPLWINWDYIKDLFIMPNGLTEAGTKTAAELYYSNRYRYPYQIYINWAPGDFGNILFNDKKFVTILYQLHNDRFAEFSKVSDAGGVIKNSIYDYIEDSKKVVVVVDCENSDPYKLVATLTNLNRDYTQKIASIILFDDIHTASAWRILERFTKIPVEHMMIERVKQSKSLVDIMLTARACQEHYTNNVDSFIVVSSDSDYWGLIQSLPNARFLVMVEREKCGPDMKTALVSSGIFYCYIDDFYSGNAEDIKHSALFREMYAYIDKHVSLNLRDMFDDAIRATRIEMTESEKKQFYNRHIRNIQMSITDDGDLVLEFKRK